MKKPGLAPGPTDMANKAARLLERLHGDVNNLVIPCTGSLGELLGRSKPAPVETVNDLDGLVVNAWRAIKLDPERVADLVDYPVHEVTLHAVHDELVRARTSRGLRRRSLKSGRRRTRPLAEYLREDEANFDARLAAWWIWGASCWLGGGWCNATKATGLRRPAIGGREGIPHFGRGVVRQTHRKRPALVGQGSRPHRGRGVVAYRTPRQLPMVSGSYTGHPAHGTGVHSAAHRQGLLDWMLALADRLRFTRIICGDMDRALTQAVTTSHGLTAVNFDTPYDVEATGRTSRLYRKESRASLSERARAYGLEHGDDPLLRVTICGKFEEHDELLDHGWSKHVWRKDGETIWLSPGCCTLGLDDRAEQLGLGLG